MHISTHHYVPDTSPAYSMETCGDGTGQVLTSWPVEGQEGNVVVYFRVARLELVPAEPRP